MQGPAFGYGFGSALIPHKTGEILYTAQVYVMYAVSGNGLHGRDRQSIVWMIAVALTSIELKIGTQA